LIERARVNRPKNPGTGVTNFSGWVFSLYNSKKDATSLASGRYIEQELVRRYVGAADRKGWELVHEGITRSDFGPRSASGLTVSGKPLRGEPDFVFRHRKSKGVVIVEVKASHRDIPSDGWPNLRAQLWAYSQIDEWKNAPELSLIGEVWGFGSDKIVLRGVRRWTREDRQFEQQNRELFELYRGYTA
jgi:hypothetical protein